MNLLSLYYFVELAKELHVTNTAQKLYISQQNLSQHIQRLEQYYGVPLFHRKRSRSPDPRRGTRVPEPSRRHLRKKHRQPEARDPDLPGTDLSPGDPAALL